MVNPPRSLPPSLRRLPRFERVVIDNDFPGGYQVEVADVNGDGRPDVSASGGGHCAWYENPAWTKRGVTTAKQTPGIISSATADLDGDGKAEIVIAYEFAIERADQGKARAGVAGESLDAPWRVTPVADLGSIHRLRWGSVIGSPRCSRRRSSSTRSSSCRRADRRAVAKRPAFDQSRRTWSLLYRTDPKGAGRRDHRECPVLHAIKVIDFDGDGARTSLGQQPWGDPVPRVPDGGLLVKRASGVGCSG